MISFVFFAMVYIVMLCRCTPCRCVHVVIFYGNLSLYIVYYGVSYIQALGEPCPMLHRSVGTYPRGNSDKIRGTCSTRVVRTRAPIAFWAAL